MKKIQNTNIMKVKLKDLIGSNFIFYKKGDSIEQLQKQCGTTRNDFVRKTPTNDEGLNTVSIPLKNKLNPLQKIIIWVVVRLLGKPYDWDSLRDKMKNEGYDLEIKPIVIQHPEIATITTKYFKLEGLRFITGPTNKKHKLVDGNHRLRILKELYGDDYEIEVIHENSSLIKDFLSVLGISIYTKGAIKPEPPKPCTSCTIENIKKYLKKFFNKVQLVNTIKVITGLVFLIWVNFKYLVWLLISLVVYLLVVRALKYFNYNPTKIVLPIENVMIKRIIMTLISNISQLTIIIPVFVISLLMIINGPLEFLIFGTIIYLSERYTANQQKKDD